MSHTVMSNSGTARWTGGFWGERFDLCRETMIDAVWDALSNDDNGAQFVNFEVAAGLKQGTFAARFWSDGDCYKWLEACAHVYGVTRDDALLRRMDERIGIIARAQCDDGYINTQIQLDPKKERWTYRPHHELYNLGHLFTAAAVHHTNTGKTNFLDVARKAADHTYSIFQPRPERLANFGWNPSNIMGLVDLYRACGDRRYLELAGIFVDMRGSKKQPGIRFWGEGGIQDDPHPGDQTQNRVKLKDETTAVGHAVTATYLYAGAADVVAETGDEKLLSALMKIWANVVGRKQYVTGAVGAYHHGLSDRRDRVHEAFASAYELPNRTAYNETCANIGNAMWNLRMLRLTGDARFADNMELVLYNSALSAMALDGTRFCYTNPLARAEGGEMLSNDTAERWHTHKCYCCPPQVLRTLASLHNWAYGVADDAVYVNLYGSSTLETEFGLKLNQRSDYPWHDTVDIDIDAAPDREVALKLRIPGWCASPIITINGSGACVNPAPGSYYELRRVWSAGDKVKLVLPMPMRLLASNQLVEEAHGQVAVARGPVVYCLESADLPDGKSVFGVAISKEVEFSPSLCPDLGNAIVLDATATYVAPVSDSLYADIRDRRKEAIPLRLIPYYTWNNRGPNEMTVWLPCSI